jgi:hypothetical protein
MVLDEAVMARGVAMHCAYAETFLNEGFGEHAVPRTAIT